MNPYKARVLATEKELKDIGIDEPLTGADVFVFDCPDNGWARIKTLVNSYNIKEYEYIFDIPTNYLLPYTDLL
jgi:hypothetical protein